ncbi:geranylgeranylglyceryl/heptaprenylglyceryl phosphate synthase [Cytophaga aurantiaca]|uniref:geranylgeranylglyceryl/heptaprenylglyceryl phosphate synthase n=1 Tax=Cytophaga aurantiaca TaxID=29530 RepID=UPI00036A18EC|nr:geranylgeranylglyceryl/heptaprenylglyceryl phosphate synthase [Cytophaga aurantiaca]
MLSIYNQLVEKSVKGIKSFAVLLDPDKLDAASLKRVIDLSHESNVDYFFLGGSLLSKYNIPEIIKTIKQHSSIPVVLFPGGHLQVEATADAILLLSLISGRNADFLIGQHVVAAPLIKQSNLEVLPTGYLLVDCGKQTTASYISNTTPLPYDKPGIAAATAMAGEMLGLKLMYLDGGSGAMQPVDTNMIKAVKKSVACPLIVGGGINSVAKAAAAFSAGADVIVVGTGIESDPELMVTISKQVANSNLEKAR